MKVFVSDINNDSSYNLMKIDQLKNSIIKEFAPYVLAYNSTIKVILDGEQINFSSEINKEKDFTKTLSGLEFRLKIVRWNSLKSNELFYCGKGDVVYRSEVVDDFADSCSVYIKSEYFDMLKINGEIDILYMTDLKQDIQDFIEESFDLFKEENEVFINQSFIDEMKKQNIYPYVEEPTSFEEKEQKVIFDVVAVHLSKVAPKINSANKITRKFTYNLINEAIKTNPASLNKIISEVFKLSKEQLDEFASLLDETSMAAIIITMNEVTDRLIFLEELNKIVYDIEGKYVKERTQFQKLLLSQIWIFGDQYKYGVDDVSLRSVLKAYCKEIGIDDIELTQEDFDNTDLNKIPDIVLWRNNKFGENYENLVIEIKRPTKILGETEVTQIKKYALSITEDKRFSKEKCKWRFIIIGKDIDSYMKNELSGQKNGYFDYDNYRVEVMTWGELITNNKLKYDYFKIKSKLELSSDKVEKSLEKRWKKLLGENAPTR